MRKTDSSVTQIASYAWMIHKFWFDHHDGKRKLKFLQNLSRHNENLTSSEKVWKENEMKNSPSYFPSPLFRIWDAVKFLKSLLHLVWVKENATILLWRGRRTIRSTCLCYFVFHELNSMFFTASTYTCYINSLNHQHKSRPDKKFQKTEYSVRIFDNNAKKFTLFPVFFWIISNTFIGTYYVIFFSTNSLHILERWTNQWMCKKVEFYLNILYGR
jgi:hypothetical protein